MGPSAVIIFHAAEPKWIWDVSGGKKELPSCADALQSPPDDALEHSLKRLLFHPQKYMEVSELIAVFM